MSEKNGFINDLLRSREPFFSRVDINTAQINCGDERLGGEEPYIHVFGGALNFAYNLAIIREIKEPGLALSTFDADVAAVTPALLKAGLQYGVHSDDHNEEGAHIDVSRIDGGIGCGYSAVRTVISQLIADRHQEIMDRAHELLPEFFSSAADERFSKHVFSAHEQLADNQAFFKNGGRAAVLAAIREGAKGMIVHGNHTAEDGIINISFGETIRNSLALKAGLPTYDHDAWATTETYDRLADIYPFEKRQLQQAEHIDTIGTMLTLGVKRIAVRRPAKG